MPIHGKDELMLSVDPFTLALQTIIIVICQPKPCITDSRRFVAKTLAHIAGIQLYHVVLHYMQILKMVSAAANYLSTLLIQI